MTPTTYYVLVALAHTDRHGYGVVQDVRHLAGKKVGTGTVYPLLERLVATGLVTTWSQSRCYYRITERGVRALEAEIERLNWMVQVGKGAAALLQDRAVS